MNDRPTKAEILATVREWLLSGAAPALKSHPALRFQALIAANVLGIVEREIALEPLLLREEWQWLQARLNLDADPENETLPDHIHQATTDLCARIRNGDYDSPEDFQTLLAEVKASVARKLKVNAGK